MAPALCEDGQRATVTATSPAGHGWKEPWVCSHLPHPSPRLGSPAPHAGLRGEPRGWEVAWGQAGDVEGDPQCREKGSHRVWAAPWQALEGGGMLSIGPSVPKTTDGGSGMQDGPPPLVWAEPDPIWIPATTIVTMSPSHQGRGGGAGSAWDPPPALQDAQLGAGGRGVGPSRALTPSRWLFPALLAALPSLGTGKCLRWSGWCRSRIHSQLLPFPS